MGSVWRATHLELDAPVAIKFIDEVMAQDEEWRARFEREAKAAAALRSPHVVQVLDYGSDDGLRYIAMELLEGEDLHQRLKRRGRMSLREASDVLNQVCKALALAADRGILHRDLKPSNIFLARIGDDEVVKVLDFGVAKDSRGSEVSLETATGVMVGSPHYMSPEQTRGTRLLDHRSDLWSATVILYRMITGARPFEGDVLGDLVIKIYSEPVAPPSAHAPDLPLEVDRFFERALCRDPEGRFQTARELAAAFALIVEQGASAPSLRSAPSQPRQRTVTLRLEDADGDDEPTKTLTTDELRLSNIRNWPKQKRVWWYSAVAIEVLIIIAAFWLGGGGDEAPAEPKPAAALTSPQEASPREAPATPSASASVPPRVSAQPPID